MRYSFSACAALGFSVLLGSSANAGVFLAINGSVAPRGIYLVNSATGVPTLVKDLSALDLGVPQSSPNSLAWDPINKHAYFKTFGQIGGDILYRWDSTNDTVTSLLEIQGSANGAWYNGSYWFITNSNGTLNRIDFKPNGDVDEVKSFANLPNRRAWNFGDVVVDSNGIMYGAGLDASSNNGSDFFKIDLNNRNQGYTIIKDGGFTLFQLAFVEGTLVGHATVLGDNYAINTANGDTSFLSSHGNGRFWLNDAATIPAPGAAWALGIIGLLVARRRR